MGRFPPNVESCGYVGVVLYGRDQTSPMALRASARTASKRSVASLNDPLTMLGGTLAARILSFSTGSTPSSCCLSQSRAGQENAVMESYPTGLEAQRLPKGVQLSIRIYSP